MDEETGGKKKRKHNHDSGEGSDDENNQEDEYVDVHDDLKREVAFYDNAMEAVRIARKQCEHAGIPFTRPEDFFAEMIKSDGEYCSHSSHYLNVRLFFVEKTNTNTAFLSLSHSHNNINIHMYIEQITWPKSKTD